MPYSWLWAYTTKRVLHDIRARRQSRHYNAELQRRLTLAPLWLAAFQRAKDRACTAFRNHAPAMRWFRSNLPLIKARARKEAELPAKMRATCVCGGSLLSSWDREEYVCRACNLGVLSNSCDCSWTRWEVLKCSQCEKPGREPVAVRSKPWLKHGIMNHFTFAEYRCPLLWKKYQGSRNVLPYL